jgi:hypothetical protein
MSIPSGDIAWSLLAFNLGVEAGQMAVVAVLAVVLASVRRSGWISDRRLVVCGSIVVAAAGFTWFVARIAPLWR